jgi:hypothetical protein
MKTRLYSVARSAGEERATSRPEVHDSEFPVGAKAAIFFGFSRNLHQIAKGALLLLGQTLDLVLPSARNTRSSIFSANSGQFNCSFV